MRRNVEAAGFSGDQGVFVGLGGGQRACRVQLGEIIFEHAFNILLGTDIPRRLDTAATNGQHLADSDNTCRAASGTSCGHHDKSCGETDTRLVFAMCVVRRQG